MAVTAKFVPDLIEALPNAPTTLTLRLYNDDADTREVSLSVSGDLGEHVQLASSTATVETNQIVDVAVTVLAPPTVAAGSYSIIAEVGLGVDGSWEGPVSPLAQPAVVVAMATVELTAHSDYTIALQPKQSRGSKRGRHIVRVDNTGNVVVTLDVAVEATAGDLTVELEPPSITLAPGSFGELLARVVPSATYWNGPANDHTFTLQATSADGRSDELVGTYQQRPRVPNWLGPAAAGAFAALLLGAVAWLAVLGPWVSDTADDAAAEAIERDRVALQERIDELEMSAAEAEELPLGQPTDIRLDVAPTGGNLEQATAGAEPGTVLSITDIVLENPTGAVGVVSLRRGDDVILQSELANFRDFDRHFVAPFQFGDDVEIVLEVECRTPGAGESICPVGALLVGFVDEAD
jgi:hypothetical protein